MRSAPDYIQFYPTLRCNRSCSFCFNAALPPLADMTLPEYERMVPALIHNGVTTIDIMGGEPTLHPEIVSMVRHAEEAGLSVNISSNGTNPEILAGIIETTAKTTVGISLHEPADLQRLRDFLAAYRPVVKSVYAEDLDRVFVDEILALQPRIYYLLYRDAMQSRELAQTVPFDRFLRLVQELPGGERIDTVYCSGFLPDRERHPELQNARCPAGTTKLGVLPDGSVYPCNLFFGRHEFRLGNILTDSLDHIWRHPALFFFREFSKNACPRVSCTLHSMCHGGCPAHSLIHQGSLAAPEPRCRGPEGEH